MYSIVKKLDGKYRSSCTIQDGVESQTHDSKDEAVTSLIKAAKIMNGTKITKKDIKFGVERQVVATEIFSTTYAAI